MHLIGQGNRFLIPHITYGLYIRESRRHSVMCKQACPRPSFLGLSRGFAAVFSPLGKISAVNFFLLRKKYDPLTSHIPCASFCSAEVPKKRFGGTSEQILAQRNKTNLKNSGEQNKNEQCGNLRPFQQPRAK